MRSRPLEDVFERYLAPLGVPTVFNLPIGHGKHLCTLPWASPQPWTQMPAR